MNKLTKQERVRVIAALVEGNSIRATVRMTGAAKNTVAKLLCDIGKACEAYHDHIMVNLPCKRIQVDEIWSFCYAKQKNVPEPLRGEFGYGDVWTEILSNVVDEISGRYCQMLWMRFLADAFSVGLQ